MPDKKIIAVIPARYSSSRFPGKPLAMINNRSMIVRVVENAMRSKLIDEVIVATDDRRISEHLKEHNIKFRMTSSEIRSGTDRCFQAVKEESFDIVVNIQGDEPLLEPDTIDSLVEALSKSADAVCSTPVKKITVGSEINDPNTVKCVFDNNKNAMYFSRSTIPFVRNRSGIYYKHIGIYAYRNDFLKTFTQLDSTIHEETEALEQLRILDNGYKIKCVEIDNECIGVDVPEDIKKVEKILLQRE